MPSPSQKHVRAFEKTRTTFWKNMYMFFGVL
ncbi:hypothetical protein HMPREF0103_1175 [Bacteroides sp. 2_1_33B]|nr:hypothetical protein HMPREF0103_1175 [Bacteroides sp. 2_1_33B]